MLILLQMRLLAGELRRQLVSRDLGTVTGLLVVMPSPMVGFGLYRAGETLTDLDGLDWCVNWVHKVLKKSKRNGKRKRAGEGPKSLERKNEVICEALESLKNRNP